MKKKCIHCGKTFNAVKSRVKACSIICAGLAKRTREIFSKKCQICSSSYTTYRQESKVCGVKCRPLLFLKPPKTCPMCFKEFKSQSRHCSSKCYGSSMKGTIKQKLWDNLNNQQKIEHLRQHFDSRVIKNAEGCWGYKGGKSKKYGSIQFDNKSIPMHRASWIIHKGPIPDGMLICHTCDNPPCTNPKHLFIGTHKDNVRDMYIKKRARILKGEMAASSKLTKKQVLHIKKLLKEDVPLTQIANKFRVHIVTIHDIKYEKTWKHLSISK